MADFKEKYKDVTRELLKLSVGEDTPYKATLDFLDEKIRELAVSNEYKVKLLSAMLPNIIVPFTTSAMQLGIELTHKHLAFNKELEALDEQNRAVRIKNDELEEQRPHKLMSIQKQNDLLDAQIKKLTKETDLAASQQSAIDKQVSDNRVIKAGAMMQEFISDNHAHSINVPNDMIRYYFNIIHSLVKEDVGNLAEVSNFTMNKR